MSALFADLGGFRMPDVTMNQGPLPSGGGINATPDGVINGTSSLLSGIEPYSYGDAARTGSDRNYQQIPHRVQYIVLPLFLPSFDSTTTLKVSHVVDQGDLAFVLNTHGRQWFGPGENVATTGPGSLPLFANLACVNYMLGCLQLAPARATAGGRRTWTAIRAHLWKNFDYSWEDADERELQLYEYAKYTVEHLFKPHGVCAGSEKQGGQHEETWAPVTAAVNYTTTMTVDGQNRDLVNYWQSHNMCAGDRLVLRLELHNQNARATKQGSRTAEFQLTSYYKRPVSAAITSADSYWQLVPYILNAVSPSEDQALREAQSRQTNEEVRRERFEYRVNGYWQIAQSFQGRRCFDGGVTVRTTCQGAPLQVTFAPVFVRGDRGASDVAWDWEELLATFLTKRKSDWETDERIWRTGPRDQSATTRMLFKFGVSTGTIERVFAQDPETADFVFRTDVEDTPLLGFFYMAYQIGKTQGCVWRRRVVDVMRSEEARKIVEDMNNGRNVRQNQIQWMKLMFGYSENNLHLLMDAMNRHNINRDFLEVASFARVIGNAAGAAGGGGLLGGGGAQGGGGHGGGVHGGGLGGGQVYMRLGAAMNRPDRVIAQEPQALAAAPAPEDASMAQLVDASEACKKKSGKKRGAGLLSVGSAEPGAADKKRAAVFAREVASELVEAGAAEASTLASRD
jgi:hypothetical protein